MSIEYLLDLKCPVKETIPTPELIPRVHERRQYECLLAALRSEGETRPASEIKVTRQMMTPDGVTEEPVSVAEMARSFKDLELLEGHCADCPANVIAKPFGCYGTIGYPIMRATEKWLMERLPNSLASPPGRFLMHAIKDCQYDGGVIIQMRQRSDLFESRKPCERRWLSSMSQVVVTSDQILQMIVGLGALEPPHCMMAAWFLGVIPHDTPPETLDDNGKLRALVSALQGDVPCADGQIGEFGYLLRALLMAPLVDAPVIVDI